MRLIRKMFKIRPRISAPISWLLDKEIAYLLCDETCCFSVDENKRLTIRSGSLKNKDEALQIIVNSELFKYVSHYASNIKYGFDIVFDCKDGMFTVNLE